MQNAYDVVIVGGGVHGLSLAYHLAAGGVKRIAVFEKSYLGAGASGRNGEMIRSAFAALPWIRFFKKSLAFWEGLSRELDFNVMFTRSGYVVLASSPAVFESFRDHVRLQHRCGLKTRLMGPEEIRRTLPRINPQMTFGGIYQPDAGFARHDAVVWAYARAAQRRGVAIFPHTEVRGIRLEKGAVSGVETSANRIATRLVVNAAGGHADTVAAMVGARLPMVVYRLQMLVTEPLKPFLPLNVSLPDKYMYMHQTTRGEFVGGSDRELKTPTRRLASTFDGMRDMAVKYTRLFPALAGVRLMRQWAGIVAKTPDGAPLLGPLPHTKGFVLDTGWGGYGFMAAPAGGRFMADYILTGTPPAEIRPFAPDRFEKGRPVADASTVGGSREE